MFDGSDFSQQVEDINQTSFINKSPRVTKIEDGDIFMNEIGVNIYFRSKVEF